MSCETCHGAGKPHADAMAASQGDDAKVAAATKLIFSFRGNPQRNSERCQQCHESSREQSRFLHSPHATHGVSCSSCHAAHLVETPGRTSAATPAAAFFTLPKVPEERRWLSSSLLKKSQPELCYGCHGNIQAKFALPSHHRVPEGAMKCTDCHNTHGTSNRATLRETGWETCVKCHIEKRGAVRLRALSGESGGLYSVPHAAWKRQPDAAGAARGTFPVPPMPRESFRRQRAA